MVKRSSFQVGAHFTFGNSTITGNNPGPYLALGNIAGGAQAIYYLSAFCGISVGLDVQQYGAELYNPAKFHISNQYKSGLIADSSHEYHLLFTYYSFPIQFAFEFPRDYCLQHFLGGMKFSGACGIAPSIIANTTLYDYIIRSGQSVSGQYLKHDVLLTFRLGADVRLIGKWILQLQAVSNIGTYNVYTSDATTGYNGKNFFYGIRVGILH